MLKAFSITDVGRKRKLNQDYVYTSEQPVGRLPNLFIVADGMGGHNGGDYASRHTVEIIVEELAKSTEEDVPEAIRMAIGTANQWIGQKAEEEESLYGMGTTVVVATCTDRELTVANVGDSRLYVVNQEIRQITMDHSLVEEMVRIGSIDRETARNHPNKNIITRAVGVSETVKADIFHVGLKTGDCILMCSDGLTNMLDDTEICSILNGEGELSEKAKALVQAANDNGGKDNISVILIEP